KPTAPDIASYTIYRSTTQGSLGSLVATLTDTSLTSWKDSGLTTGTTYFYTVKTVDQAGNQSIGPKEVNDGNTVGYWKLNEQYGQVVADSSGAGNDGTRGPSSSPEVSDPTWKDGTNGAVLSFDGVNDLVKIPN